MADLDKKVRNVTDTLDAVGNTTAAIGKGFAIGSAALTALALFSAYATATGLTSIDILVPEVIVGLFIGGMRPYLFASLTMSAVGRAAFQMINECGGSPGIAGIMEGKHKPEYATCVDISTAAALREMIVPGLLAVLAPVVIDWRARTGGLGWSFGRHTYYRCPDRHSDGDRRGLDNAKKYIEEGHLGVRGPRRMLPRWLAIRSGTPPRYVRTLFKYSDQVDEHSGIALCAAFPLSRVGSICIR